MEENNILNFQTNDISILNRINIMMPDNNINPFSLLNKIVICEYIVYGNQKIMIDHRTTCGTTLQMYSTHFNKNIISKKNNMVYIKLFPDIGSTYNYLFSDLDRRNSWIVDITIYTSANDSKIIVLVE